jgi:hypothetical protein
MKYCKDCKWFQAGPSEARAYDLAKCLAKVGRNNPVSGIPEVTFCENQRTNMSTGKCCGPDAIYFEPKEATP